jgi:SAM-dependent methyltransferase
MHGNYRSEERAYREGEATGYEAHFSDYQNACELRDLRSFLKDQFGLVVDIGCGTQRFQGHLRSNTRDVIGLDFSFDSLVLARSKGPSGGRFVQGDVTSVPLRDDIADMVVSIQVLEHLMDRSDALLMVQGIQRIMKQNARAYLTVYNLHVFDRLLRRRRGSSASHRFVRYSTSELRSLLRQAFGDEAVILIRPQCLFLRRGQRWLQRFENLDRLLAKTRLATPFASFLAVTISRTPNTQRRSR